MYKDVCRVAVRMKQRCVRRMGNYSRQPRREKEMPFLAISGLFSTTEAQPTSTGDLFAGVD